MSRITPVMAALKSQGRKALIPYLMAGYPDPSHTLSLMHALVQGGADIIELGVPFSDPMADGPVIQQAGEEALRHHVGMHEVLAMVQDFRRTDTATPIVLMADTR
jgi:tryptophan synthase alpha chain